MLEIFPLSELSATECQDYMHLFHSLILSLLLHIPLIFNNSFIKI